MSKYNNILNLFSLTLVLIILFVVMYGCQFRMYNKKRIERFSTSKDEKDSNEEEEKEDSNEEEKEEEEQHGKEDIGANENFEDRTTPPPITKQLSDQEARLLEGFINEKFTDSEINDLISTGEFKKEYLENMINYIDNLSKKK